MKFARFGAPWYGRGGAGWAPQCHGSRGQRRDLAAPPRGGRRQHCSCRHRRLHSRCSRSPREKPHSGGLHSRRHTADRSAAHTSGIMLHCNQHIFRSIDLLAFSLLCEMHTNCNCQVNANVSSLWLWLQASVTYIHYMPYITLHDRHIHTYPKMHTYINKELHTYKHYMHACMQAYIHAYIHTYMQTFVTYIPTTYIHTYLH